METEMITIMMIHSVSLEIKSIEEKLSHLWELFFINRIILDWPKYLPQHPHTVPKQDS